MKTFRPGEVARAEDVNANFNELKRTLDTHGGLLKNSGWSNLTLGSGWTAVNGHTPRCRFINGLIQIEGAVLRGIGGYLHQLARLPDGMRPSKSTYLGTCVAVKNSARNSPCEIYVGSDGWLSINYMNEIDAGTGWYVPLSLVTAF